MARTVDIDELRERRDKKYAEAQQADARLKQAQKAANESAERKVSALGAVTELNRLIAVVDPDSEEAKAQNPVQPPQKDEKTKDEKPKKSSKKAVKK